MGPDEAGPTRSLTDDAARRLVADYADETLRLSGWSGFAQSRFSAAPCVGRRGETSDEIYAMQGAFQLLVPGPDQQALIDRVRAGWQSLRYTIVVARSFGPGLGGEVHAVNPGDATTLMLTSGAVPALALLLHSGCYRRT